MTGPITLNEAAAATSLSRTVKIDRIIRAIPNLEGGDAGKVATGRPQSLGKACLPDRLQPIGAGQISAALSETYLRRVDVKSAQAIAMLETET
jgi:hypothetical protein